MTDTTTKIIKSQRGKMIAGTISEQYRCLVEILTCTVCKDLVSQAHICPNCSKFYCLDCINRQLKIEQKCLNCSRFLTIDMLSNCQKLCADLTQTLQKVKLRGMESNRTTQDKSPYYCYRHKLQKSYYCQTCDKSLCSDCSVLTDTHRGHEFIKLSIIKANYERNMSQRLDEINTFSQNIDQKVKMLNEDNEYKGKCQNDGFIKLQSSMKSLRDLLKKKSKKLLNEGEKKLTLYNESLAFWNERYESWMKVLKTTSKGKFVEQQCINLEQNLFFLLKQITEVGIDVSKTKQKIKQKNVVVNYVNPQYYTYIFILQKFSQKRSSVDYFYTDSVTTKQGLQLRLKIYPKGINKSQQQDKVEMKIVKKQSKHEQYLGIFIELVDGPVTNTKLKHQIILNNQNNQEKQFARQFESQFDVGLCWGYENYIKLNQLYEEGYYNRQFDFIEVTLKIGPCSYYLASKDQLALIKTKQHIIKTKQEHIDQLQKLLNQKSMLSTASLIEIASQDQEQ